MGSFRWLAILLVAAIGAQVSTAQEEDLMAGSPNRTIENDIDAQSWFNTYGYTGGDGSAEQLFSLTDYKAILTAFQKRYNLPVTGTLNEETKELMSSPRCGYPDHGPEGILGNSDDSRKKRFTRTGTVWPRRVVTYFIEGTTPDLPPTAVESEIQRAFQRWDDESGLTLMKARSASTADIRLSFQTREHGDGNAFDGRGGTLAHAYGPGGGLGGDVHFDDDETFNIGNRGVDLHIVATHEIGHSLGLAHSTDSNAVMAPFYRFESTFNLERDDINGIQSLYGRPPATPPVTPPTLPPPPPTTRPTTTTPRPTTPPPPPTYCSGKFDAVANSFDGGLYMFQGSTVLKVHRNNRGQYEIASGYPRYITQEFPGVLPDVDAAVLFRYSSGISFLYIFKADLYWRVRYSNNIPRVDDGYPQSITQRWGGIPRDVDAAFFWTGNSYLYFIKGNQYYRYNFYRNGLDYGYPRRASTWVGVSFPVAAAFDFRGQTYFFQEDNTFQLFNDRAFRAGNRFPISSTYLGCTTFNIGETTISNSEETTISNSEETTTETITCGSGAADLAKNPSLVGLLIAAIQLLRRVRD